jgi:cupin fold WbuC family metalloprotein
MHLVRVSEEAYFTTDERVVLGTAELERLKVEVLETKRKRIRICTHRNIMERHHEFFIVMASSGNEHVKPNKHLSKDETVTIVEGEADAVFYNDTGDVLEIVPLGQAGSGKPFYLRIPADTWHNIIPRSEILVMHEATPGPYIREHTLWAKW